MSIQTVADWLVELTRIGQHEAAQNELFADDAQRMHKGCKQFKVRIP